MEFADLLKNLRKKKGVSIKKMAKEVGLDYTYISKLENSKVNPSSKVVKRISNYFGYNSDELLLSAGKIPKDIEEILRSNPQEAVKYFRSRFGGENNK